MKGGNIGATRHNIRAKAFTRAFNRAVANVLGTGEVSADELDTGHDEQPQKPQVRIMKQALDPTATQPGAFGDWYRTSGNSEKFAAWITKHGIAMEDACTCLGVENAEDLPSVTVAHGKAFDMLKSWAHPDAPAQ